MEHLGLIKWWITRRFHVFLLDKLHDFNFAQMMVDIRLWSIVRFFFREWREQQLSWFVLKWTVGIQYQSGWGLLPQCEKKSKCDHLFQGSGKRITKTSLKPLPLKEVDVYSCEWISSPSVPKNMTQSELLCLNYHIEPPCSSQKC